jgi:chromosome segregation ATPase
VQAVQREAQDARSINEIQLKKQRAAIQDAEKQVGPLKDKIKALEAEVSSLQQELALLKSLKAGGDTPAIDTSSEDARIDQDPIQAAHHFLKLLRTVQKEYRIL